MHNSTVWIHNFDSGVRSLSMRWIKMYVLEKFRVSNHIIVYTMVKIIREHIYMKS